jgi:hypothetical protein
MIAEAVIDEKEVVVPPPDFPGASHVVVVTNEYGVTRRAKEILESAGFTADPLSRRYLVQGPLIIERLRPLDKSKYLSESVTSYFRNKMESLLHCSKCPGDVYTFSVSHSTDPNSPFFLTRARVDEACKKSKAKRKEVMEWFSKLFPSTKLARLVLDEELELAFYADGALLEKITLQENPVFPADRIDGYQEVEFAFDRVIPEEKFTCTRAKMLETGAAVCCSRRQAHALIVEIPCCYNLGGVVGRAFESRLSFILRLLEDAIQRPSYSLMERRSLREGVKRASYHGTLTAYPPGEVAYTKRLFTVDESAVPFLFSLAGSNEVFMLCETGNFLGATKSMGRVNIFHGVLRGHRPLSVVEHYPHLVALSKGEK